MSAMRNTSLSRPENGGLSLSQWILVFALAYAVLIMAPAFLSQQFGLYSQMKTGDVLDLVTPLVLIPLYWVLFRASGPDAPGLRETVVFLILSALWVEGQGIHLAANSIGHLTSADAPSQELTHFYDEVLSHYMWHFGLVALSALLIVRQWRHPLRMAQARLLLEAIAGVIYGAVYFITFTEGATAPLGIPFALVATIFGLTVGRNHLRQQPVLAFFTIAHLVALALFVAWFLINGGTLPEFSDVGLI